MGDIPAGWLAILSPIILAVISGLTFAFRYVQNQLEAERATSKQLRDKIQDMQDKSLEAMRLQLEVSQKNAASNAIVARSTSETNEALRQVVKP